MKIIQNNNLIIKNNKKSLKEIFIKYKIDNVAYKIQDITKKTVFFAICGLTTNGNNFINKALTKNVNLVFTDDKSKEDYSKRVFFVENIKEVLNHSLEILYAQIPQKLIAVTGTNGKTSITLYIGQMLSLLNIPYICIGTFGIHSNIDLPSKLTKLHDGNTVPNKINFRKILHEAYTLGIKNAIFEISSHAIDQNRAGNILVDFIGFASFSQDHLDYHKTIEAYFNTKLSFLKNNSKKNAEIIVNDDHSYSDKIVNFCKHNSLKCTTVGKNSDISILEISVQKESFIQKIKFQLKQKIYQFKTEILGNFQVNNILIAALLTQKVINTNFDVIFSTLNKLKIIESRLENVIINNSMNLGYHVFIDYAHTPDALGLTLITLKQLIINKGRLIVIFGCGGEKDLFKRPLMGKISSKIADQVIITDDNPRGENPSNIRQDIIKGIVNGASYQEYSSRKLAIEETISNLKQNDILLIAGKGTENYQIIKNKKIIFNDKKVVLKILSKKNINLEKFYHLTEDYNQKTLYS